ncbi:hypothetical protein TNCV_1672181 [Trichonephila clavipes]|nr:hypothetical protein TNCV_1672181 [Trichonephila clavipes]
MNSQSVCDGNKASFQLTLLIVSVPLAANQLRDGEYCIFCLVTLSSPKFSPRTLPSLLFTDTTLAPRATYQASFDGITVSEGISDHL